MNSLRPSYNDTWPLSDCAIWTERRQAGQAAVAEEAKAVDMCSTGPWERKTNTALSHGAVPSAQPVTDGFISPVCMCKREGGAVHLCVQLTLRHGWEKIWKGARMRVQHDKFSPGKLKNLPGSDGAAWTILMNRGWLSYRCMWSASFFFIIIYFFQSRTERNSQQSCL